MSIMNRINKISQLLRSGLWATAMLMCVTACTDNEIVYKTGQKPDTETLETVSGTLRSSKSLRDRIPVHLTEDGEEVATDQIYYRLTQAASQAVTLPAKPDPE